MARICSIFMKNLYEHEKKCVFCCCVEYSMSDRSHSFLVMFNSTVSSLLDLSITEWWWISKYLGGFVYYPFSCSSFRLTYFDALLLGAHKFSIFFFCSIDLFIIIQCPFLTLITFLDLKSSLCDVNIVISAFLWLVLEWYILLNPFILNHLYLHTVNGPNSGPLTQSTANPICWHWVVMKESVYLQGTKQGEWAANS